MRLPFGAWWLAEKSALDHELIYNEFERMETEFVKRLLRRNMTVVDAGGQHSSYRIKVLGLASCVLKLKTSDWREFMKEHLLSLVSGRQGHFRLESGHHGELWFQLETLCLNAREIQPFAARLAEKLKKHEIEVVCGPLVEGAFVAMLVSLELGCEFVYAGRFFCG